MVNEKTAENGEWILLRYVCIFFGMAQLALDLIEFAMRNDIYYSVEANLITITIAACATLLIFGAVNQKYSCLWPSIILNIYICAFLTMFIIMFEYVWNQSDLVDNVELNLTQDITMEATTLIETTVKYSYAVQLYHVEERMRRLEIPPQQQFLIA